MKILYGFSYYPFIYDVKQWVDSRLDRIKQQTGIEVESVSLTPNPPSYRILFPELDKMWKRGDIRLMNFYEQLARKVENFDVFINWNGVNLHPRFVEQLSVYKVFGYFDDPELSSESKPVANAYDLCLVGNIAEIDTYKSWGVKNVEWWPIGFHSDDYNPNLKKEDILNNQRTIDLGFVGEVSEWKKKRFEILQSELPNSQFYGSGWQRGYLSQEQKISFLQQVKVGPNLHNSTGPINFRTFILPANGVMQICDNKSHLSKIFELDKEVVGFDTLDECIELCKYYVAHDDERKKIAAAGWERTIKDYNESAVFLKAVELICKYKKNATEKSNKRNKLYINLKLRKSVFILFKTQNIILQSYHLSTQKIVKLSTKAKHKLSGFFYLRLLPATKKVLQKIGLWSFINKLRKK